MSGARVRLGRIALRREISPQLVVAVLAAAAAAVVIAYRISTGLHPAPSLFGRALMRFDLTLLYLGTVMAVMRIGGRIEQDERAQWLDAFVAAGAGRIRYAFGIAAGAFAAASGLFVTGAVTFAAAVFIAAGSSELLVQLPRTLGGGLLLLLHWCAWFVLVETVLRRSMSALFLGVLVAILPFVLLTLRLLGSGSADAWLVWLVRLMPPLVPAADLWMGVIELTASAAMAALTARAATSFLGRHT